jgi:hypothetical protein
MMFQKKSVERPVWPSNSSVVGRSLKSKEGPSTPLKMANFAMYGVEA